MRGVRGFSLLEACLGLTLAALIIMLLALLGPSLLRTWRRCDLQSDVQRTALLSLVQIRNELSQGYGPSLQCPSPAQLSFASRLDIYGTQQYAASGQPLWQKWVTFRWDVARQRLIRRYDIWPQPQPRVPTLPYASTANFVEKKVADNLRLFRASALPSGQLQLDLTVQRESEQARLQTVITAPGEESD